MSTQQRWNGYVADQRAFFDELITRDADTYFSADWDAVRRYEVRRLMRRVQPATVLNVGCGCGFHDAEMAKYPFVRKVDAIDYSPRSVEFAETHYPSAKVTRCTADLHEMEVTRGYDLVVSFQVIEHVPDPVVFLRACSGLCVPDGRVAVFTVNRMRPYNRKRLRAGLEVEMEDPMHRQEFSCGELRRLGGELGLEAVCRWSYAADIAMDLPVFLRIRLGAWAPRFATRVGMLYRSSRIPGDSPGA